VTMATDFIRVRIRSLLTAFGCRASQRYLMDSCNRATVFSKSALMLFYVLQSHCGWRVFYPRVPRGIFPGVMRWPRYVRC